jgi:hypothetical protein
LILIFRRGAAGKTGGGGVNGAGDDVMAVISGICVNKIFYDDAFGDVNKK